MECIVLNALVKESGSAATSASTTSRWNALSSRLKTCGYAAKHLRLRRSNVHRLEDKTIHLLAAFAVGRLYLEKEEARIFGELPLQFSNDAPAVI